MQELVTRAQADTLFTVMAVLGLITGAVAAWLARRRGSSALAAAALWGGPLVLTGVLWRVYNAITDGIGLDSVANLALNTGLFLLVGLVCGLGWTYVLSKHTPESAAGTED
ncbi:MAG: hypothetical protein V4671_04805 [Armatimonadota bacterium]